MVWKDSVQPSGVTLRKAWSGEFWGWFIYIIYVIGIKGCWIYKWGQMASGINPRRIHSPEPIWHHCYHLHLEVRHDSPWLWSQYHPPRMMNDSTGAYNLVCSATLLGFFTSFIERYKTRHLLATDHFCVRVTQKKWLHLKRWSITYFSSIIETSLVGTCWIINIRNSEIAYGAAVLSSSIHFTTHPCLNIWQSITQIDMRLCSSR